jgi:hypothetical protein
MVGLFACLFLCSFVFLIIGLINPHVFSRKGAVTRKKIGLMFGIATFVFFVLFGVISDHEMSKHESDRLAVEQKEHRIAVAQKELEPKVLFSRACNEKKNNRYDSALGILQELQQKYPTFRPDEVSVAVKDFALAKVEYQKEQEKEKQVQEEKNRVQEEERKIAFAKAMRNLVKSRDEIEDIDWYIPRIEPCREIHAYIGKKNDTVWLRFRMAYCASDWLFVHSAVFKVDGEKYELHYGILDDWERKYSSSVQEWKDVVVDAYIWNIINKIADSEKTLMRYEGQQSSSDREISTAEKLALKDVILAYQAMGGKPPQR